MVMRALVLAAALAGPAAAQHAGHGEGAPPADPAAPYAGLETRDIASLSASDIAQIEAGAGWGLALAAELNGWPGPLHVLENADALELTEAQRAEVEAIRAEMNADARAIGAEYLAAEAALDAAFADHMAPPEELEVLVLAAAEARGRLRARHLAAHLETTPLLTHGQRMTYASLRGYAGGDHGAGGDAGHDGH